MSALSYTQFADRRPRSWTTPLALGVLGVFWWLAVGGIAFMMGHAGAYDFGYYVEAIRRISQGALNPTPGALSGHTYLADNIALFSYPVALLFRLWPSPWLLISLQATWFGALVAMVVQYARGIGLRGWPLGLLAVAILLYPPAAAIAVQEFHFDPLAAVLGMGLFLALRSDRPGWSWFLLACTLLVKEDAGLVVASVALLHIGLSGGTRRTVRSAWVMAAIGLLAVLAAMLVMPKLSAHHAAYMQRTLFGPGTVGLHGELSAVLGALFWPAKWLYLVHLLLPLMFLPLLRPRLWPAIAAAIAVNFAVLNPAFYSGFFQYTSYALPALFVASAEGLVIFLRLARSLRPLTTRLAIAAALLTLLAGQGLYGWPPLTTVQFVGRAAAGSPKQNALLLDRRIVGRRSLLATNDLLPYLDQTGRTKLVPMFTPVNILEGFVAELGTRYIALDSETSSLPMHDYLDLLPIAERSGYRVVSAKAGVILLQRRGALHRPRVIALQHLKLSPRWTAGSMQRLLGPGITSRAYTAQTPLAAGWWNLNLAVEGSGVAVACATAGPQVACSFQVPLHGQASVIPLQLLVPPQHRTVTLSVGQFGGTGGTLAPRAVKAVRLGTEWP